MPKSLTDPPKEEKKPDGKPDATKKPSTDPMAPKLEKMEIEGGPGTIPDFLKEKKEAKPEKP